MALENWKAIWEREPGLRPDGLWFDGENTRTDTDGTVIVFWYCDRLANRYIPTDIAADLQFATAVRWLVQKIGRSGLYLSVMSDPDESLVAINVWEKNGPYPVAGQMATMTDPLEACRLAVCKVLEMEP